MTKSTKRKFVAEIELKSIHAELVPAKRKDRPPKQVGQGRYSKEVRLHGITLPELKKRLVAAEAILRTGKLPKEEKTVPSKSKVDPDAKEKAEIHAFLESKGGTYNKQLGIKKLRALKEEVEKATPPADPDGAGAGAGEPPPEE